MVVDVVVAATAADAVGSFQDVVGAGWETALAEFSSGLRTYHVLAASRCQTSLGLAEQVWVGAAAAAAPASAAAAATAAGDATVTGTSMMQLERYVWYVED